MNSILAQIIYVQGFLCLKECSLCDGEVPWDPVRQLSPQQTRRYKGGPCREAGALKPTAYPPYKLSAFVSAFLNISLICICFSRIDLVLQHTLKYNIENVFQHRFIATTSVVLIERLLGEVAFLMHAAQSSVLWKRDYQCYFLSTNLESPAKSVQLWSSQLQHTFPRALERRGLKPLFQAEVLFYRSILQIINTVLIILCGACLSVLVTHCLHIVIANRMEQMH